jgi:predicted nucleic acid-binding protein
MIDVSDTSVVTSLIQIGQESLLKELHGVVLIPPAVEAELLRVHIRIPSFLEVRLVKDLPAVARLTAELDAGEAEAIVLAKEAGQTSC